MDRRTLTVWIVVFSTLAWIPGGFSRFVFAKLLVMAIACVVGATVRREGKLPRSVALALSAGAAVFVLAALLGDTPVASLVGRWPRYEGLPVIGLYAASAWLGARVVGRGESRMAQLVHAVAAMVIVLFVFSAFDAIDISPLGESNVARSGSLLGNATDQGLVAMMAVILIVAAVFERRTPYLLCALAAGVGTVALSGSRTALLLTAGAVLALALTRKRQWMLPATGFVAGLAALAFALPQSRDRLLNAHTVRGRVLQWDRTLDLVRDHPLLGLGPSRYVDAFGAYEDTEWVEFAKVRTFPDSPHNVLLQVQVAGGIPLLLSALVVAGLTLWLGWKAVRTHPEAMGLLVAVTAYGAAMLANFTIASSTCLAAFLAGALIAQPAERREPAWRSRALQVVFATASVVMLMACVSEVHLQRGLQAAHDGRSDEAASHLDSARRWRSLDGDLAMLGAQSLSQLANQGDPSASAPAIALATSSLDRTPDTYASKVALAVALLSQNRLQQARGVLDSAIAGFPHRPSAYIQRGIARFGLRDVAGARKDLRTAQRIAPHFKTPGRILRIIQQRVGD